MPNCHIPQDELTFEASPTMGAHVVTTDTAAVHPTYRNLAITSFPDTNTRQHPFQRHLQFADVVDCGQAGDALSSERDVRTIREKGSNTSCVRLLSSLSF